MCFLVSDAATSHLFGHTQSPVHNKLLLVTR